MIFTRRRPAIGDTRIISVPTGLISPSPDNVRSEEYDPGIKELAASIMRYGVLQPLKVRPRRGGYELISGSRRLAAASLAGLGEVPCIVLDVNDAESSALSLVENLQRRGLDFIEEAEGLRRLMTEYGYSQEEAARSVGRSQSAVANKLRILRLPEDTLSTIKAAGLTERHARALLRLPGEREMRSALGEILRGSMNVAQTETLVESILSAKPEKPMFIIKDVRIFLNTLEHNLELMRSGGIAADMKKRESDGEITVTIRISKPPERSKKQEYCAPSKGETSSRKTSAMCNITLIPFTKSAVTKAD